MCLFTFKSDIGAESPMAKRAFKNGESIVSRA